MNKFEYISTVDETYVKLPKRATKYSAGYDFFSPGNYRIRPKSAPPVLASPNENKVFIHTGIKCKLDPGCVLLLDTRSSMGIKKSVVLANTIGVIDADYYNNPDNEGEIIICLQNDGIAPYFIEPGDKIAQGIIVRYETVEDDNATDDRIGGIGSTS